MSSAPHIVFGTGPLGRATAEALLAAGQRVTIASRSGTMPEPPVGATLAALDLANREATATACRGAASLYFCAAPPYHRWERDFPALLDGAIAAAQATGARLVVADNLYAYGPVDRPMTEAAPLRPSTRKGQVRATMHGKLVAAQSTGSLQFVSARGSDFFGPWVDASAVGSRLIAAIDAGKTALLLGGADQPHSFTYVGDFGRALAMLGTGAAGTTGVWHVPNAPAVTPRRFVEIAAGLAGTTPRLRTASRLEQRAIGLFIPAVREGLEMRYQFDRPFIVDHHKFADTFGDIATPIESALAETLSWWRARGTVSDGRAIAS